MNRLINIVQAAVAAAATALVTGPRPAVAQIKPLPQVVKLTSSTVAAPQGLTVAATNNGPQITWQPAANASSYRVQRATTSASAAVTLATVASTTLSYVDRGYAAAAVYSVVAVGASGQTAASVGVSYTPPAPLKAGVAVMTMPVAVKPAGTGVATQSTSAAPQITSVGTADATGRVVLHIGDTVTATGTGLSGLTSLGFTGAYCVGDATTCRPNPNDKGTPATVLGASSTSVRFVVPTIALPYAGPGATSDVYYYITARRDLLADTTAKFWLGAKVVVRKITDAQPRTVRAGGYVTITGVGLETMQGAYFGTGVAGSVTNPELTAVGASTSITLHMPSQCDQQGILMLSDMDPTHPTFATYDSPITLSCVQKAPTGQIVGTESGGTVYVKPGGALMISGHDLRIVTDVHDSRGDHFPFTYTSNPTTGDRLSVTIPATTQSFVASLANPLTGPAEDGTINGFAMVMVPPTWVSVTPTWAEPGQLVSVQGSNLSYGVAPQVTVGGAVARIKSYTASQVQFYLGAGTTSGPIVVTNGGGSVQASGPYSNGFATAPGFYVVSGSSSISEILKPRPTINVNDTLVVHGQNLSRLGGICVSVPTSSAQPMALPRIAPPPGHGYEMSNTEMLIAIQYGIPGVVSAPIYMYAPTMPAGDYASSNFACTANPGGGTFP